MYAEALGVPVGTIFELALMNHFSLIDQQLRLAPFVAAHMQGMTAQEPAAAPEAAETPAESVTDPAPEPVELTDLTPEERLQANRAIAAGETQPDTPADAGSPETDPPLVVPSCSIVETDPPAESPAARWARENDEAIMGHDAPPPERSIVAA